MDPEEASCAFGRGLQTKVSKRFEHVSLAMLGISHRSRELSHCFTDNAVRYCDDLTLMLLKQRGELTALVYCEMSSVFRVATAPQGQDPIQMSVGKCFDNASSILVPKN